MVDQPSMAGAIVEARLGEQQNDLRGIAQVMSSRI